MKREQREAQREVERVLKRRKRNLIVIAVFVFILGCVISYKKIELNGQIASYEKKIAQLEKEKAAEEKRTEEIEEYEDYVQSKKYIEQEARDKLGLVYPDEIVFEPEK